MSNAYSFRGNLASSHYDQLHIGGHSNTTNYLGGVSMNAGSSSEARMQLGSNANEIRLDERIARLQEIVSEAPRLQLRVTVSISPLFIGAQFCLLGKGRNPNHKRPWPGKWYVVQAGRRRLYILWVQKINQEVFKISTGKLEADSPQRSPSRESCIFREVHKRPYGSHWCQPRGGNDP